MMMTNATKTLAAIFSVLVLLTLINLAFSGRSKSAAFDTNIVAFDSTKVDRILIQQHDKNPVELVKRGEEWKVVHDSTNNEYPASESAVQQAISEALGLQVKSLVTRSPEKFSRFQVDSTGTLVEFFRGSNLLDGLMVGKFNFVSRSEFNTYVKGDDTDEVFAVEGFVGSSFNKDLDAWREKQVWDYAPKEITQVSFTYPADSSYSITRVGDDAWVSAEDTLKTSSVNSLLSNLGRVNASGFSYDYEPGDLGTARFQVRFTLDNGSQKAIRIFDKPDDGARLLVEASEYPYVFEMTRSSVESNILRPRSKLLRDS